MVLLLTVVGVVVVDGDDGDGVPSGKSHRLRSQDILASFYLQRVLLNNSNVVWIEEDEFSSGTKEKLGRHRPISFFTPDLVTCRLRPKRNPGAAVESKGRLQGLLL